MLLNPQFSAQMGLMVDPPGSSYRNVKGFTGARKSCVREQHNFCPHILRLCVIETVSSPSFLHLKD